MSWVHSLHVARRNANQLLSDSDSDSDENSDSDDGHKNVPREVRTRKVWIDAPPSKYIIDEVEELGRNMPTLDIRDVAYSGYYTRLACLALAAAQVWPPPRSGEPLALFVSTSPSAPPAHPHPSGAFPNMHCFFCGLPHLIRNCPSADEYVRLGCVIKEDRYFLFPDRSVTTTLAVDERRGPLTSSPATGANTTAEPKKN